jgi:hypothetical protein
MNIDRVVNFPYPTPPDVEQIKVGEAYKQKHTNSVPSTPNTNDLKCTCFVRLNVSDHLSVYVCSPLCMCLFIALYVSVHLSVYVCSPLCMCLFTSLYMSVHLSVYVCSPLCICLFTSLYMCVHLSVYVCSPLCMCVFTSLYMSVHLSVYVCSPLCTRVVQKVRGQLRFYHFNWVNIYIPYTKMFVVKFQFKIKWILIFLVSLN